MKRWWVLGAVALVVAAAGTSFAAIPGASGVIHACYKPFSGALRLIDAEAGAQCTAKEEALHWGVQGPKGDKGEKGDKGDKGDTGPQGLQGPAGEGGLSEVFARRPAIVELPMRTETTVGSKRVPPGRYVLLAEGSVLARSGPTWSQCTLQVDGSTIDGATVSNDQAGTPTGFVMVTAAEIEGSSDPLAPNPLLEVECYLDGASGIAWVELAVLPVGAIR